MHYTAQVSRILTKDSNETNDKYFWIHSYSGFIAELKLRQTKGLSGPALLSANRESNPITAHFKVCVDEFVPFTGVWFSDVVPLTLQQHGADVVLALQQQKRVQITAQDAEQPWSNKHRQGQRQKKKTKCVKTQSGLALWGAVTYCTPGQNRTVCLQALDQSTNFSSTSLP